MTEYRVAITGAPNTGKTTLADALHIKTSFRVIHTDEHIEDEWSVQSQKVVAQMEDAGPWIVEGCTVPRAIRKWGNVERLPCTHLFYMTTPRQELTKRQLAHAKGIERMMNGIVRVLQDRGVCVLVQPTLEECVVALQ